MCLQDLKEKKEVVEEAQEEEKENGNEDAPANGTAVCKRGGDFPAGLGSILSPYCSSWCRCRATHSRPSLCPAAVQGCALCLGLWTSTDVAQSDMVLVLAACLFSRAVWSLSVCGMLLVDLPQHSNSCTWYLQSDSEWDASKKKPKTCISSFFFFFYNYFTNDNNGNQKTPPLTD